MRVVLAIGFAFSVLSACTGHQYEPREPGISVSGEAKAGLVYRDGEVTPHRETTLSVHMGGSI